MSLASIVSTNFREFSFSQIQQLKTRGGLLQEEVKDLIEDESVGPAECKKALITFKAELGALRQSIVDYHPSICQRLIDLFTLRCCKRNRLNRVVNRINVIATGLLDQVNVKLNAQQPPPSPPPGDNPLPNKKSTSSAPKDAKDVDMGMQASDEEMALLYATDQELIKRGILTPDADDAAKTKNNPPPKDDQLDEEEKRIRFGACSRADLIKMGLLAPDASDVIEPIVNKPTITMSSSSYGSALNSRIAPPEDPVVPEPVDPMEPAEADSVVIAKKISLIKKAQQTLAEYKADNFIFLAAWLQKIHRVATSQTTLWKTAEKVEAYFKKCVQKLENNENIPLPRWYHATKVQWLNPILKGQKLKQFTAIIGEHGVFVGSAAERTYGNYVFALDEANAVAKFSGEYFPSEDSGTQENVHASLWVCVRSDIALTPQSVAFVACATVEEEGLANKFLSDNGLHVEVVSRAVSDMIRQMFEFAEKKRDLPVKWRRSAGQHQHRPMPGNMRHFTPIMAEPKSLKL